MIISSELFRGWASTPVLVCLKHFNHFFSGIQIKLHEIDTRWKILNIYNLIELDLTRRVNSVAKHVLDLYSQ